MKYDLKTISLCPFRQRGITLLEALIALLILALGVLGLAVVQGRTLVEIRTTNARATAIRLIADLDDRIRLNYQAEPKTGISSLSPYDLTQQPVPTPAFTYPDSSLPSGIPDCSSAPNCSPQVQAAYDVWVWRTEVASLLPGGVVNITQVPNSRQLQVVVAWRPNENSNNTLTGVKLNSAASYQQVALPLRLSFNTGNGNDNPCDTPNSTDISPVYICHVDFIDMPSDN
jgi:type IV pilus assembly protein PilV